MVSDGECLQQMDTTCERGLDYTSHLKGYPSKKVKME